MFSISSTTGGIAEVLRSCPNLVFLSLDLCSFLEQPPTSPSFNKILRETHFSRIERLEVRVDKCGKISAVARAKCVSKIHLLAASLLFVFFLVKVTGEVPSNISSLLLLRSTHLRRIHLSRPPVSLLERLLVAGSHHSFGNSKCHMYIVQATSVSLKYSPLQVRSSPSPLLLSWLPTAPTWSRWGALTAGGRRRRWPGGGGRSRRPTWSSRLVPCWMQHTATEQNIPGHVLPIYLQSRKRNLKRDVGSMSKHKRVDAPDAQESHHTSWVIPTLQSQTVPNINMITNLWCR